MTYFTAAVLTLATSSFVWADSPASSDLISAINNLSSADGTASGFSLQIDCPVDHGVPARINLCWELDGRYSFLLSESQSGTPVALFTDGGFFLYDVVDGTFLVGSGMVPSVSMAAGDETIKLAFSFAKSSKKQPDFDVNLISFLKGFDADTELSSAEHTTTLSHASPSKLSTTVWTFENETPITLTELRVERRSTKQPAFLVSRIRRGSRTEYVSFPRLDSLRCEISEWNPDSQPLAALELFTQSLRAVAGQAAILDERFRTLKLFAKDVDWTSVQDRADLLRKPLNELLYRQETSPTRIETAPEQPDEREPE